MSDSFCCSPHATHGLQVVPNLSNMLKFSKLPQWRQGFHPSASTTQGTKSSRGVPALGAACICAARMMHPSWVPARRQVALCTQGLWGWDFGTSGSPGCATSGNPRVCHPKWDSASLRFDSFSVTFQGEVWGGVIFPSSAFVITSVRLLGLCRLKCLQFGKATFFQEEKLGK